MIELRYSSKSAVAHSGSDLVSSTLGRTLCVDVASHAVRTFWVCTAFTPATVINSSPTPSATAAAVTARRATASRPPLTVKRTPKRIMTGSGRGPAR
jgi:hypothetical protein